MKRISILPILLVLSLPFVQGQMNKIKYKEYTLDNGLHVILHEDHTTPNVVVSVMYHVGSKNENPNRTGFAHFFEHLLFEGSDNIKRGEFGEYLSKAGGSNNANTTYDRTYYYDLVPSNQLALGLWLESERMLHAKVDKVGVDTQREVVKEERRLRIDNQPYGTILEESMKRAFTKHPYHSSVIGSMEHLSAATEADYKQFYKDFYVPNNAILSIAGDIDSKEAERMILKYFSTIPANPKGIYRPDIVEPEMKAEVRDTIYDNIQLPAVAQTYRIPAAGTPDFYAVKMLATLLSEGESSRMKKSLIDDKQLAVFTGAFPLDLEDPGVSLAFSIAAAGVSIKDVEDAMDAEFEKAGNELIPEKEFQKLQNQVESEFVTANSSIAGIAENLANYKMYYGDTELINTEINRYLKVTREDIKRVAKKYFNKNNRVVLYYLPKTSQP